MAYAGARLGEAVLKGLSGQRVTECAYVKADASVSELPYFSTKVTFGPEGVEKVHPIGTIDDREKDRLKEASAQLKGEIDDGLAYAEKEELRA